MNAKGWPTRPGTIKASGIVDYAASVHYSFEMRKIKWYSQHSLWPEAVMLIALIVLIAVFGPSVWVAFLAVAIAVMVKSRYTVARRREIR